MLSSVTLDDINGNPITLHQDAANGKRWLTSATGLRGVQSLRASKRVRPQTHGGINETRYEDGRSITLLGEIMSTVSVEDAFNEWALITEPMLQTLDTAPALLKWQEGSGALNFASSPTFLYDTVGSGGFAGSTLVPSWFIANDGTSATVAATPTGIHSQGLRVVTSGSSSHEGYAQGGSLLPPGSYMASVWVFGAAGGEALQVFAGITSPGTGNGVASFTATTTPTRYNVTFTSDGITPVYVGVRTQGTSAVTFVLDSLMIVAGSQILPYFDGDTNGDWLGTPGASESRSGHALQRLVKLDGDLDPPMQGGAADLTYQAQFFAEDPRAYSQTLQTVSSTALSVLGGGLIFDGPVEFFPGYGTATRGALFPWTFTSSGGGTVSFTNAGNRPTPPVFQAYGMCVNPQIVLSGTGLRLMFNGTIAAGDYLEIDIAKRTVMLNGATNRLNFYDGANSTWFELPAGTSNLQLVAASFDSNAMLKVIGRSAYA
jgi:Siphovirus-type tail component, C-terminal domain